MRAIAAVMAVALVAVAGPLAAKEVDNRDIVSDFVSRFYDKRDVAGAFAAHVAPDYIQHNPGMPDGRAAAVEALAPMFARAGSRFDVRHVLVDGDLALVHLFGRGDPATPGAAVADIYRLKGGKIVEHWDVLQPLDKASPTSPTAAVAEKNEANTSRNRAAFTAFIDQLFGKGDVAGAYKRFVAPDLVQHNSRMGQGRDAAVAAIAGLRAQPGATFTVQRVLVDGDLAAVHYRGKLSDDDKGAAVVEIFRFDDKGMMVEHWDMFQPMPTTSRNAHPMF